MPWFVIGIKSYDSAYDHILGFHRGGPGFDSRSCLEGLTPASSYPHTIKSEQLHPTTLIKSPIYQTQTILIVTTLTKGTHSSFLHQEYVLSVIIKFNQ